MSNFKNGVDEDKEAEQLKDAIQAGMDSIDDWNNLPDATESVREIFARVIAEYHDDIANRPH